VCDYEEAFEDGVASGWESASGLFPAGPPPPPFGLDDILDDISADTANVGGSAVSGTRTGDVVLEYKPESPLSHQVFSLAANALVGQTLSTFEACGCTVAVTLDAASSSYNQFDGTPGKKSPKKCKGGFKTPKGKTAKNTGAVLTSTTGAASTTAVAATLAVVVVVAAGLVALKQRYSRLSTMATDDACAEEGPAVIKYNPVYDDDVVVQPVA